MSRIAGLFQRHAFFVVLFVYVLSLHVLRELNAAVVVYTGVIFLLYALNDRTRYFLFLSSPWLVQNMLFDALRFIPFAWLPAVHVVEPYRADLFLFGVPTAVGRVLPSTWLLQFHSVPLDVITGFLYNLQDIFILLLIPVLWRFGSRDLAKRFSLSFLLVNLFAYATYLLYPAAPPWYVAEYGLRVPTGLVPGSAAGLIGFDRALGIDLSRGLYEMNPFPFGALPSMHAGYAMLAYLFVARMHSSGRYWMAPYLAGMLFSAVYLQHHYVVDLVLGLVYTVVAIRLVDLHYVPFERWFFAPFRYLLLRGSERVFVPRNRPAGLETPEWSGAAEETP